MQQSYYSAAWSDIKNSPGWFGKICLMGLVNFIPVFGSMVVNGYAYGWARDIAWNVHQPMPARLFGNEDGKLYSRGASAWLILFIVGLVSSVLAAILGDSTAAWIAMMVISVFLEVFASVGIMRMSIYGRLSAGFQLKKVWAMVSHDSNGFLRIVGMFALLAAIFGVIVCVVTFIIMTVLFLIVGIAGVGAGIDLLSMIQAIDAGTVATSQYSALLATLGTVLGVVILISLPVVYFAFVAASWINLMLIRAMGYWTRQFDVASWRGQDDPMPFEVKSAADAAAAAAANAAAVASAAAAANAAAAREGQAADQADQPQPSVQQPAPQPSPQQPSADSTQAAAPVDKPAASGGFCPYCGKRCPSEDSRFCPYCGKQLK